VSGETQMRRVIEHAAEKLLKGRGIGIQGFNHGYPLPATTLIAMAYAEGVLNLLAAYLKVDDARPQPESLPPAEPPAKPTSTPKSGPPRPWRITYLHVDDGRRRVISMPTEASANSTADTLRAQGHTVEEVRIREATS
jgi:Asp-tRNA(Asn)/Glu-tRNA(Gln) amidotransferase A subunit family amidase